MILTMTTEEAEVNYIVSVIEERKGFSFEQMKTKSRTGDLVVARHLAIYFIKLCNTRMPYRVLGAYFGNRDHTTIMHALESIEDRYDVDRKFRAELNELCIFICPTEVHRLGTLMKEDVK